jgi:hypothetical protein
MLESVFLEMVPFLEAVADQVRLMTHQPGAHLPRFAGPVVSLLAGRAFTRLGIPYTLWMAQRVLDVLSSLPLDEADDVRRWVKTLGGEGFLQLRIPRLNRVGVHAALVAPAAA